MKIGGDLSRGMGGIVPERQKIQYSVLKNTILCSQSENHKSIDGVIDSVMQGAPPAASISRRRLTARRAARAAVSTLREGLNKSSWTSRTTHIIVPRKLQTFSELPQGREAMEKRGGVSGRSEPMSLTLMTFAGEDQAGWQGLCRMDLPDSFHHVVDDVLEPAVGVAHFALADLRAGIGR